MRDTSSGMWVERRILVIDDNPAIHEDFRKILAEQNFISEDFQSLDADLFTDEEELSTDDPEESFLIDFASQGEEGYALVVQSVEENRPYMMAIVDMRMPPGWTGLETIERIWPVDPSINIVICSAYSDHPWEEISKQFRHKRKQLLFLSKPFQPVEVKQIALALTSQWQLAKEVQQHQVRLEAEVEARTAELQTTELKYRTIFEKIQDAVLLIHVEDGTVVDANHQCMALLKLPQESLIGRSCYSLLPEKMTDKLTLPDGAGETFLEHIKLPQHDHAMDVEMSVIQMLLDGENKILLLIRDVSKRSMLENQLRQAQKLESMGHLAAGVAHEINTPIQFVGDNSLFLMDAFADIVKVLSMCDTLMSTMPEAIAPNRFDEQNKERKEELQKFIKEIDLDDLIEEIPAAIKQSIEGVQRVAQIVGALKSFSHPGTGTRTQSDLNVAIANTLTVAKNEWKYVANVETILDPHLPLVECHLGEMNQVFLNIVINAAHAIEGDARRLEKGEKGVICVTSRMYSDEIVEIVFDDNGPGIPDDIKQKIFDPFFTTKEVGKGTGQGLAIAHSVVTEMHNGTLSVDSKESIGTTFTIRIPVSPRRTLTSQIAEA